MVGGGGSVSEPDPFALLTHTLALRAALLRVKKWDEEQYGWEDEWVNQVMPLVDRALAIPFPGEPVEPATQTVIDPETGKSISESEWRSRQETDTAEDSG
jgi:hypothetical protein